VAETLQTRFFRQDLITLLDLLRRPEVKPLVAHRIPLSQARQAQELLAKGGVIGKIVLMPDQMRPQQSAV
jgi:NADPH:quinone reductase-like Zn-dependent oxidoreductase